MRQFTRLLVAILAIIPSIVVAQNRISSITIGSGQTPIASGITGITRFESTDSVQYGEFAVQSEQAWLAWGRQLHGGISGFVAGAAGYYQGAPWAGPYIWLSMPVTKVGGKSLTIGTLQWPAVFAYEPDSKKAAGIKPNGILIGYLGSVSATWGPVTLSHGFQKFLDNPWNRLPGASVALPLAKDLMGTVSYTWNTNTAKAMYYIGATLALPRK